MGQPDQEDELLPPLTAEDKMLAGLCYPFWPFVPFFVLASDKRQDPFLLFHALQGLAVGGLSLVTIGLSLLLLALFFPHLPTSYRWFSGLAGIVLMAACLALSGFAFALSIFLGWQASSGRFLRLRPIGEWCEDKMAQMLGLTPEQLRALAIDRSLALDEKLVVLQPISTPEQLVADMENWSQKPVARPQPSAAQLPNWGEGATGTIAIPQTRPPAEPRVSAAEPRVSAAEPSKEPEVKPWRPATVSPSHPEPSPKPVNFPRVSRQEPEEKKKWWMPKEA